MDAAAALRWPTAGTLLGIAAAMIALSIPLLRGRVPPNLVYGVRIRRAFASEADWYAINRYGARQLIGGGAALALAGLAALAWPPRTEAGVLGMVLVPLGAVLVVVMLRILRFARRLPPAADPATPGPRSAP